MGGTVTKNLTDISLCEATTGWTAAGGTNTLNADVYVQGSNSIHNYSAGAAARGADYDLGAGGTNLSNQTIYCWFSFSKKENIPVKGANGMRIRLTDTSSNWAEWDIFGSDTLPHGGWIAWATRTSVTASRNGGTAPNLSLIRYVGWRCGTAGTTVVGKTYIYFDAWRYGSGLNIKGGTSGDPATLEVLYTQDSNSSNAYGVIDKVFGVYYVQGQITIGSTTAGDSTYFLDKSNVVVFKDAMVGSGFYSITGQGNATGTTEIYFGEESGSRGINGDVIRCASSSQTPTFAIDLSSSNITKYKLHGCSVLYGSTVTLATTNADKKVYDTSFVACAEVLASTCDVQYCNFISAAARAVKIDSTSHNIKNSNFINCQTATELTAGTGTYTFDNLKFSGNTYDIENSTSGACTIQNTNGSNPSDSKLLNSGGGSITFAASSVTLKVIVQNSSGTKLQNIRVGIYKVSDNTELLNTTTDSNGEASTSFSWTTNVDVSVRARKSSSGTTRYVNVSTLGTITSTGLTSYITMTTDSIVAT